LKGVTRGLRERKVGGEEGMERKLNGNYLRLIPGLCLEDKTSLANPWWHLSKTFS
jgi:hypothetical protein